MTNSRKSLRTESNYKKVEKLSKIGCTTSEIAKFMKLSYNQVWFLRKDLLNKNQKEALNDKAINKLIVTENKAVQSMKKVNRPSVKKNYRTKEVSVNPKNVKVKNDGKNITITINLAM
jgi:hypothetical protein